MSSFYKLQIKEVKRETPNAVSVLFNVPNELKASYTFTAGQYLNLKLTLDGQEIRRAYSICSSPDSGDVQSPALPLQDPPRDAIMAPSLDDVDAVGAVGLKDALR